MMTYVGGDSSNIIKIAGVVAAAFFVTSIVIIIIILINRQGTFTPMKYLLCSVQCYVHFKTTHRSSHYRKKNSRKTLATKISEAYNTTNAWSAATSEGREQVRLVQYAEYTQGDSAVDVYMEEVSTFSKFILSSGVSLLHLFYLHPLVSESNAIPVDQFQDYLHNTNLLKKQYRVRIIHSLYFIILQNVLCTYI